MKNKEQSELTDQLIERAQQLNGIMKAKTDNFDMSVFLMQSIAKCADNDTLKAIIDDFEQYIVKRGGEDELLKGEE